MDSPPGAASPRPRPRPRPTPAVPSAPPSATSPSPPEPVVSPPPRAAASVALAPSPALTAPVDPADPAGRPQPPRTTSALLGAAALLPGAMFCLAACALLILGSGHTSEVFAWTAGSPAAAASLGAAFAAGAVFLEISGLAESWVDARLGVVTLLTATPLLLIAAALRPHDLAGIDTSSTRSAQTATAVTAVWWIALAALFLISCIGLRVQLRATGNVSRDRMPLWARIPSGLIGLAVVGFAGFAYVAPADGRRLLPFATSPMDVRALAAVHVAIGVTLLAASVFSASRQQAGALAGLAAYLAVQGAVLALRRQDVSWHGAAIGFLVYLLVLFGALILGLWQFARAMPSTG